MQIWVYFIRISLLVLIGLCMLVRFRRSRRSEYPQVVRIGWTLFGYFVLFGIVLIDVSWFYGTIGWNIGVEWILPLGERLKPITVFLTQSFVENYPLGALIVLWLYAIQGATYRPGNIPAPSEAQCWRLDFRRFVCLLVLLAVYVPAIVIFGLRLFVHLYATANNLTAGA